AGSCFVLLDLRDLEEERPDTVLARGVEVSLLPADLEASLVVREGPGAVAELVAAEAAVRADLRDIGAELHGSIGDREGPRHMALRGERERLEVHGGSIGLRAPVLDLLEVRGE